uniref:Uncharacterized protein n=2 Tax=Sinocyclocheilus TaxID=75365 RepID=A0A672N7P1_SINGR
TSSGVRQIYFGSGTKLIVQTSKCF